MRFRLHKRYIDVVGPDGSVGVFYLTSLGWGALEGHYDSFEWYPADGQMRAFRAHSASEAKFEGYRLYRFELEGRSLDIQVNLIHSAWRPPTTIGLPYLWSVDAARTHCLVRWQGEAQPLLEGEGYIDTVVMDQKPRELGILAMDWGRIHLPDQTVVYNVVDHRCGTRESNLMVWTGDEMAHGVGAHGECVSVESEEPGLVSIQSSLGNWVLKEDRVLHSGSVPDPLRFPRRSDRILGRVLGGEMDETRCISRVIGETGAPEGWALHEHVTFGVPPSTAEPVYEESLASKQMRVVL